MNEHSLLKTRKIFCISCAFGAGVFTGFIWKTPSVVLIAAGLIFSLSAAFFYKRQKQEIILALCIISFFLGVSRCAYVNDPVLPPEGRMHVEVEALGISTKDTQRARVTLKNVKLTDDSGNTYKAPKAYWTYYLSENNDLPFDGQKIEFSSKLYHPSPAQNPYGFDFRMYLLQRGITIGLSGAENVRFVPTKLSKHASPFVNLKVSAQEHINKVFGQSCALPKALLIGVKDGIDDETSENFRLAGISHVLAISGLHISLLVYVLNWFFSKLKIRQRASNIIILLFLLFYCIFLNFSSSVVRASVMAAVLILGKSKRQRRDTLTSLSAAFLIILIFKPLELFNAGFQLSFLAVLGIIISGNSIRFYLRKRPYRKTHSVWLALGATLGAWLFTLPVIAKTFHFVPFASLLFSPIAISAVAFLMPMYIFVILISFIYMPLAQNFLAIPVNFLTEVFKNTAKFVANIPMSSVLLPAFPWYFVCFYYACLLLLSRYVLLSIKKKSIILASLAVLVLTNVFLNIDNSVTYTMFSVGQADSACIEYGQDCYIIDTGADASDLANYVLSKGKKVKAVFISHMHDDHAGGLEQLIKKGVKIEKIYTSYNFSPDGSVPKAFNLAKESGIPAICLNKGDALNYEKVHFCVLWPDKDRMHPKLSVNDRSMALHMSLDGVDFLSCGDLGKNYEKYGAVPANVLKASHHGSKSALSEEFLRIVKPDYVLVSTSETKKESFNHIKKKIHDSRIITSFSNGAVSIICSDGKAYIRRFN